MGISISAEKETTVGIHPANSIAIFFKETIFNCVVFIQ
jgi:hypothetical protein